MALQFENSIVQGGLINPFHIAHSQSQEAGDWIYIDSSPILGGDERQSKIQSFASII